jgi:hypothetical protein
MLSLFIGYNITSLIIGHYNRHTLSTQHVILNLNIN